MIDRSTLSIIKKQKNISNFLPNFYIKIEIDKMYCIF